MYQNVWHSATPNCGHTRHSCVLCGSQNKQLLSPYTVNLIGLSNRDVVCLLRGTSWSLYRFQVSPTTLKIECDLSALHFPLGIKTTTRGFRLSQWYIVSSTFSLRHGVASFDDWRPTFRESVAVSSSRVEMFEEEWASRTCKIKPTRCRATSHTNRPVARCHVPEERRPQCVKKD